METLFDTVSVAKGRKAGHLRYSPLPVYVSLKDTLFGEFTVLSSSQLFNPSVGTAAGGKSVRGEMERV